MKTNILTIRVLPEQPDHQVWQSFQMQQQQEPPAADPNAIPNPFADIDKDLLDDPTRAKIEAAEKSFATIAKDAKEAQGLRAQQALHQAEIDKIKSQANSQATSVSPSDKKGEQTLEDEVRSFYQEAMPGADPKVIEANVKLEMKKMTAFGNRLGNTLGKVIEPLQANDNTQLATNAFQEARQSSPYMQNDEVAEAVWAKVQNMVKNGHAPSAEIVHNFAKIAHVDYLEKNPNAPAPVPISRMQTQQTRMTFPGAGHSTQLPVTRPTGNDPVDAETAAAVNATIGLWPVQPKGFDKKSMNNGMHVTRG